MGIFSGRPDADSDDDDPPVDDSADFIITDRQRGIRNAAYTRRMMERTWAQICGPDSDLAKYAEKLRRQPKR